MIKPSQRDLIELLNAHRDFLLSKVSKVRILGEAHERELKDVFVELSIADERSPQQHAEFLDLMDSAMRRRFNPFADGVPDEAFEMSGPREKETKRRVRPVEFLQRRTKAIIIGAPGCGKTTLLKYLALQALEQERLVVWLELKAIDRPLFAQAETAAARSGYLILPELWLKYLQAQLSLSAAEIKLLRAHWQEKFQAYEIVVLLDGFDELQDEATERSLNKCVGQFVSALHDNTLLISTRPYAQARLGHERLPALEIEPLNQRQIAAFLNCYYPDDAAIKSLLKILRERSSLRELLDVPLLLGVVLRLQKENSLTDERLKLYEAIIADLIHKLDRSKSVTRQFKINDEGLRLDFLKFLAFERLLRDPLDSAELEANRIVFSYDLLKEKARTFLAQEYLSHNARDLANDALATPLLREVGADNYAFTHLILQEYLAARAFATFYQKKSNEFEGLKIFCRAYHNPTMVEMEVLPMMLGALSNADKLYAEIERWPDSLTFANLRLRARSLTHSARINQDRLSKLIDRLFEVSSRTHSEETPYREIVINSFACVSPQAITIIETKAAPFIKIDAPNYAYVAEALGRLGSDKAVPALIAALQDENWLVRRQAAEALGQIGSDKAIDTLIAALHENRLGRRQAVEALGQIGSDKAVDALIAALQDEDIDLRMSATFSLGRTGSDKAVDALIAALQDEDSDLRGAAAYSLGRTGSDKAVDPLIAALQDENRDLGFTAVKALGQIGSDKSVDTLIAVLQGGDRLVNWQAAEALGQSGSDKAVDVLIAALQDEDSSVRGSAADALGQTRSGKAIDTLIAALQDKDSFVHLRAAYALGQIGSDKAVDTLIEALQREDRNVRWNAARALGEIRSDKAVDTLIAALQDEDSFVRWNAARALGRIGSDNGVDELMVALHDEDSLVRRSAAKALGQIGSYKAVAALISALQDEDSLVHGRAAQALAQMNPQTLISGLARAIKQRDAFARKKAVLVIAYYSDDELLFEQLKQLSRSDEDHAVRAAAREVGEKFARKLELLGHSLSADAAQPLSDSPSKEGVLVHEVGLIVSSAGHFFREVLKYDEGIDGEVEFRNEQGRGSGQRVYLQLKSGDSYLRTRKRDGKEVFTIKPRHAQYWQSQAYPVLLVIRDSRGQIRWMNVTEYLQLREPGIRQIEFQGEAFTAQCLNELRARFAP
jgi:HEAT repeat protein